MPRSTKTPTPDEWLQIAKLHYEEGLNNKDIASRLHYSTKKTAWLLQESGKWLLRERHRLAKMELGENVQDRLEQALREEYKFLKKVIIVPGGKIETEEEYTKLIRLWAAKAAIYFDELVDARILRDELGRLRVSVSGGESLLEVMNALDEHTRWDVEFYASAFIGRSRLRSSSHVDAATNATIAWARSGRLSGHCFYATLSPSESEHNLALPFAERKEAIRRELGNSARIKPIRSLIEDLDKVTVAFAGLGLVNPPKGSHGLTNRLTATGLLKQSILPKELASDGALGDLAYCFFDANGDGRKDWRFFLTSGHYSKYPGIEYYRKMVEDQKRVIVIAGTYKFSAILAALKGKLFNVWITDEDTAQKILTAAGPGG